MLKKRMWGGRQDMKMDKESPGEEMSINALLTMCKIPPLYFIIIKIPIREITPIRPRNTVCLLQQSQ